MKILIVDDKEENRYFLESLLKGFVYEVISAVNGKDALEKLSSDSFNMIISDVLMPEMDGFQLLKNVKDNNTLKNIPFVFYTATYTSKKDIEFGLKLGADEYIQKPIDPEEFIKIIQCIIRDAESGELKIKKPAVEKEEEVFKLYNERLVRKLEKKMLDLESEITKRKQTENALQTSKTYLKNIITTMTDALFVVAPDATIQTVNATAITLLGYTEEELIGKPIETAFGEEGKEEVFIEQVLSMVERKLQIVYDHDPEDFLSLLKTAPLGTVIVDSDGKIVMVNEKTESIFGYGKGELIGKMIHVLLPAKLRDAHEKKRVEFLTNFSPRFMGKGQLRKAQRKDGTTFAVEVGLVPIQIDGDMHVVSVIRDPASKEMWEFIKLTRFGRLFSEEEVFCNVDRILIAKNGKEIPVLISGAVMWDNSVEIYGVVLVAKDITERKKTEVALKESERSLATLMSNLPGMAYRCKNDIKWMMEFVSSGSYELTGYHPADLINNKKTTYGELIHTEDREQVWETVQSALRKKEPYQIIYRILNIEKEEKWVWEKGCGVFSPEGELLALEGFISDITDRKRAEEALKKNNEKIIIAKEKAEESEEKFKAFTNQATEGITVVDMEGNYVFVNPAFCKMSGYTKEELLNMTVFDMEAKSHSHPSFYEVKNNMQGVPVEVKLQRKDKTEYLTEIVGKVIIIGKQKLVLGTVRDITERKRAEEIIKKSEASLAEAQRIAHLGSWEFDLVENILKWSKEVYNVFEIDPEKLEASYEVFMEVIHPEDREFVEKTYTDSVKNKTQYNIEHRLLMKDGTVKFVNERGETFYDDEDKPIRSVGIVLDITERKKAEEALRESEEKYRHLIEQSNDAVYLLVDEKFEVINPRFTEMFGYTLEETNHPDFNFIQLVAPKSISLIEERIEKQEKGEELNYIYEFTAVTKEGKKLEIEVSTSQIKYREGTATQGIIRDITERKKAQEEILKLTRGIEQSPAMILITDTDGNIEFVNPNVTKITGYSKEELLGKNPKIFQSGKTPKRIYTELWETILKGETWEGEFLNKRKNGEEFWESERISPIFNNKGEIINYIDIKEDITENIKARNELLEAKEKAEESDRLKSHFLALMSHELRTPMAGILGYAEILQDEIKDQELKEFAKGIYSSGSRLTNTLDSILNLSRLEVSKPEIHLSNIDFEERITELVNTLQFFAKQKKTTLNIVGSLQPLISRVDKTMFDVIIVNLVNNAIKYTEEGIVTIRFHKEKENSKDWIVFKVEDTGIGISDDKLGLIFKEFRQVDEGIGRNFEGLGLGLSIAKKYIERMNGLILVESKLKKGSTFTVKLPYYPVEEEKEVSEKVVHEKEKIKIADEYPLPEVLLVEDDDTNIHVTKLFLKNVCKINIAKDGQTALKLAGQTNFSTILMDINLGKGLTGIETTKEIRKIPGYENTPIVALTAYAMAEDKEQFLIEGCTHYLAKPFSKDQVVDLMDEILWNN